MTMKSRQAPASRERDTGPDTGAVPITRLLRRAGGGDAVAVDALYPAIYAELKRLAVGVSPDPSGNHTLSPTALVNEAWIKLAVGEAVDWHDRKHFYRYAARAMRSIVVDAARARLANKRGGGARHVELDPERIGDATRPEGALVVDQAVERLQRVNPRLAEIVELRVFAGLEFSRIARLLDVHPRTISREWRKARVLVQDMVDSGTGPTD